MKKTMVILSLAVSSLLLSGCGAGEAESKSIKTIQPHKKEIRELKDWTWNVDAKVKRSNNTTEIKTYYYDNIPNKIEHFQVFIDSDNNTQTGYNGSDGWEVFGADYLIEDNKLFKSQSDSEYKWQYIKDVTLLDNQKSGDERAITLTTDSLSIENKEVNIYIEPYDSNWIGEYFTIPLPDIKVTTSGTVKPPVDNTGKKVNRAELDEMIANDEDYSKVDVSEITDMSELFSGKEVKFDITGWDVSHVRDMSYMFSGSKTFNQPIESWDVSHVINMSWMFSNADKFNQPIGNWDVSHVRDMSKMFSSADKFNQLVGSWDVSHVKDMSWMFNGAEKFNQAIGDWDVSSVTDMSYMFYNAKSFNQSIGDWDVNNITNMSAMFKGATSFNQPIEKWDVSHVTKMSWMFSNSYFNQSIGDWDVSNVKDMYSMFYSAYDFNQNISSWDVSNVTKHKKFNDNSNLLAENLPHFQ